MGNGASSPSRTDSKVNGEMDETLAKIEEIKAQVNALQQVRVLIAAQSKTMSDSKILEKMSTADVEVEKREVGTFHVSKDRTKSMEEYHDGTTIRRIDGSIERKKPDGTIEQISDQNEVTVRTVAGDISVLAEHDTLLNQRLADGTQIQTNLESRVQIKVFTDGRRIETDANTKTTVTLFPDGKQITVFDDNTRLTLYPDGRSRQVSPNGTIVTIAVDGTKEQTNPDGSSIIVYTDGRKVRTLANGTKIESFPNGVTQQIDTSTPKFGERTKAPAEQQNNPDTTKPARQRTPQEKKERARTPQDKKEKERARTPQDKKQRDRNGKSEKTLPARARTPQRTGTTSSESSSSGLPSLTGDKSTSGRGHTIKMDKKSRSPSHNTQEHVNNNDNGDSDDDHAPGDSAKVSMSMTNLIGAIGTAQQSKRERRAAQKRSGAVKLKNLTSAEVIRLLDDWGMDVFRKDFATNAVTGRMLHQLSSLQDPIIGAAPSSIRKEFYYRLQQAKKHGVVLSPAGDSAMSPRKESPSSKIRRAVQDKLLGEDNSLDKSKLMWGSDFDPDNIRNWIERGAFIDWHNPEERGCTIVHMVAKNGRMDALAVLIEMKADLNAMNNRKTTALHLACRKGHEGVVKMLLQAKANPKIRNKKGTALDEARAVSKSPKIANMRANIVNAFGHLDQ